MLMYDIDDDSCLDDTTECHEPVVIVWKNNQWMFDDIKYRITGEEHWAYYTNLSNERRNEFKVIGNVYEIKIIKRGGLEWQVVR